jgi:hypothetical protein
LWDRPLPLHSILQLPIQQLAVDREGLAVGLSAKDKPDLSPRMPVLHAVNLIAGDFPGTFSQSDIEQNVVHL